MKRKLSEKLRSKDGASLVVALLVFLVCAVVGSVVLAGASAVAGRISDRRQLRQERFALESAANAIVGRLLDENDKVNMEYSAELTYTAASKDENANASIGTGTRDTSKIEVFDKDGNSIQVSFANAVKEMMDEVVTKLWGEKGELSDSWPSINVASQKRSDYVKESNVLTWSSANPMSGNKDENEPNKATTITKDNSFYFTTMTISLGENHQSLTAVKASVSINQNGTIVIVLSVDTDKATKIEKVVGQALELTINAQPTHLRYDTILDKTTGNSQRKVYYSVGWDNISIEQKYIA